MYYTGGTMPRKPQSKKTEQYSLAGDVLTDEQARAGKPVKMGDGKKGTPPLPAPGETSMVPAEPVAVQRMGRFPAPLEFPFPAPIPVAVRPEFEEIGEIMRDVCRDFIDDEYYYLGILLLEKLARKRPSPLLAGKSNAWAAGILFALGRINFLFDKSSAPYTSRADLAGCCGVKQLTAAGILVVLGRINLLFDKSSVPYISRADLAGCCGVKQSTAARKSKQIRDMFKMYYWDSRFSTQRMIDRNPLRDLVLF
jgi:hypothetical protein